ncbi:MAG: hypothetical protein AAGH64_05900 [Planctomycetota bacterium]
MHAPPLPAQTTVAFHCPCIRCRYDLFGIEVNGRCPECGTRVGASHQGPTLASADPAWLRTIARGQSRIAWASTVWTLAGALFYLFALLLLFRASDDWRALNRYGVLTVAPCVVAGLVLLVSGGVAITAREPGAEVHPPQRAACRGLLWIALALGGAMGLLAVAAPLSIAGAHRAIAVFDALIIALGVVAILLVVQGSSYLSRLAIRLPDPPFARTMLRCANTTVVFASLGAGVAAVTSLDLFGFGFGMPYWSNPRDRVLILGIGAIVAAFLACAGWWSVLMHRLARRLRYIRSRD